MKLLTDCAPNAHLVRGALLLLDASAMSTAQSLPLQDMHIRHSSTCYVCSCAGRQPKGSARTYAGCSGCPACVPAGKPHGVDPSTPVHLSLRSCSRRWTCQHSCFMCLLFSGFGDCRCTSNVQACGCQLPRELTGCGNMGAERPNAMDPCQSKAGRRHREQRYMPCMLSSSQAMFDLITYHPCRFDPIARLRARVLDAWPQCLPP